MTKQFLRLRNEAKRAHPVSTSYIDTEGDRWVPAPNSQSVTHQARVADLTSYPCRSATARLVGAALGSDVELGNAAGGGVAPLYVERSERVKAEMGGLKVRLNRLKE